MSIKSRLDKDHLNEYDGYFHIEVVDYPINSEHGPIIYRTKDYFKNEINEAFVKDIFEESFINSQKGTMANLLGFTRKGNNIIYKLTDSLDQLIKLKQVKESDGELFLV